jgi:hypothetical protein
MDGGWGRTSRGRHFDGAESSTILAADRPPWARHLQNGIGKSRHQAEAFTINAMAQ